MKYGLLPQEYGERIAYEQWARLTLVIHTGIFLILTVGTVLLLPSYLFLTLQEPGILRQVDTAQKSAAAQRVEKAETTIRSINQRLRALAQAETTSPIILSDLLLLFTKTVPVGIRLTNISWGEKSRLIEISGTADTRGALLSFIETLKAEDRFEELELPVSSLLQGKNISFSFSMRLTQTGNDT